MTRTTSTTTTYAIFGATRGIGLLALRRALAAGHQVRILVRSRARFEAAVDLSGQERRHLTIVEGDATNVADARSTVNGADAVLCALGAPALSGSKVRTEGTAAIIAAMEAEGVRRIVAVSVYGVGDTVRQLPFFIRYILFPLYLFRVVPEHAEQERLLAASGLDWTAVRPPTLVDDDPTKDVMVGFATAEDSTMTVSREAVADFLLESAKTGVYVGQAPGISYRRARTAINARALAR